MDSDGKPDVITTNASSNTVSVLLNETTGAINHFASPVSFPTGTSPANSSVGDVDGDGRKDLVVANAGSNTVSVFRNLSTVGTVSFAPRVDFPTGSNPRGLAIQDLDEDGRPEIVITNYASKSLSVLKNTSSGIGNVSFVGKIDYATGNGSSAIAVGDMNGDSKPDLAVANALTNAFSIFKNTGAGGSISFAAKADFHILDNPAAIAISDLDKDGRMDVAMVVSPSNAQILVYRNTSSGGNLSFEYALNLMTEIQPTSIAIANINGDDKPDLVVSNDDSAGSVSVYKSTSTVGNIWFNTKTEFTTGNSTQTLALGDVNEDGRPDIIAGNYTGNTVSVLLNQIPLLSNVITIDTLSSNTYCIGGSISVPFTATGTYGADNVFTVELSDGSGIFTDPVSIGTIAGTTSNTINATIPDTTYPFHYYKVRIRSSNPVIIGPPITGTFSINDNVPIAINGNTSVCHGTELALSATSIDGARYYWTGPNGFSAVTKDISITDFNEADSGKYTVLVKQNGCSSDTSVTVHFNPLPAVPFITATKSTTICLGECVGLVSSSVGNNQWYKDGIAIHNAIDASYTASQPGNYTLRTIEDGCASGASKGIDIITKPIPIKPVITALANTLSSSAASGNQWYLNGTAIMGANKSSLMPQVSGQYTVLVTQNNCSALSDTLSFVAKEIAASSQLEDDVSIYPNPVIDKLVVANNNLRILRIQLVNAIGRIVYSANLTTGSVNIPMKQLPGGTYYLRVTDTKKNEMIVRNIVK
jgi:hypothetical protein